MDTCTSTQKLGESDIASIEFYLFICVAQKKWHEKGMGCFERCNLATRVNYVRFIRLVRCSLVRTVDWQQRCRWHPRFGRISFVDLKALDAADWMMSMGTSRRAALASTRSRGRFRLMAGTPTRLR